MKHRSLVLVSMIVVIASTCTLGMSCSREKTIKTDKGEVTLDKDGNVLSIKTDEAKVKMNEKSMEITTEEGAVATFGKDELPKDLSNDIPVYKPSKVTMSQSMEDGKKTMLILSTDQAATEVKKFYEEMLAKKGWTIRNTTSMGPATIFTATQGEKKISVTVAGGEEETNISIAFRAE